MTKMNFKFKRISVPAMTIEAWKGNVHQHLERVDMNATNGVTRIKFKEIEPNGFLIQNRFIHYCEANASGNQCSHIAVGLAVASQLGIEVEKVGFPKEPSDYDFLNQLKEEEYKNVNEEVGLLPIVKEDEIDAAESVEAEPEEKEEISSAPATPKKAFRNWKQGWNDVQAYLEEQGLSTRVIIQIQKLRKDICESVQMTTLADDPIKPKTPYIGPVLGRTLRHILNGKDILLIGEKGSGKDKLVQTLSWILSLPLYLNTGNVDENKDSVVGERTVVQGLKGMEVEFEYSPFATAVEQGGMSHIAELNMMPGDTTSIFHSVLDDNQSLPTPKGVIKRHPHHIFIGSINVGDQYVGAKKLNGALKDRLALIKVPFVVDFKRLLESATGLTDPYALDFLAGVKKAVDEVVITEQQGEESKTIRGYIDCAKYFVSYGFSYETKKEAIEDFVINKTEDFEEGLAVRDYIRQKAFPELETTPEEEAYYNGSM